MTHKFYKKVKLIIFRMMPCLIRFFPASGVGSASRCVAFGPEKKLVQLVR